MRYIQVASQIDWQRAVDALSRSPWIGADEVEVHAPLGFPTLLAYETEEFGGHIGGLTLIITHVPAAGTHTLKGILEAEAIYKSEEFSTYAAELNKGDCSHAAQFRQLELKALEVAP